MGKFPLNQIICISSCLAAPAGSCSDPALSLLPPKPEVTTQGDVAWGSLAAGARQLPLLKRGGGRCFLQGFGTRRRLADGGIKRQWGSCPVRAAGMRGWRHPAPQPGSRLGYGLVWGQEMLQQRLPVRTPPTWARTTALPTHKFSCCLNGRGSRCGGGRCRRGPEKGAPPLPWVTKGFAPRPLAGGGSGLPGLAAHTRGPEDWEQASCPVLPKQCSSTQSLASAFVIYLKFKSMPGPSG